MPHSNHYKYQLATGKINFDTDTFIYILMQNTFTFNVDNDPTYASVSSEELATAYGYTQKTESLGDGAVVEDDANNMAEITFALDPSWAASGGSIGPSRYGLVIDDTTTDDTVIGANDFGSDQTATAGGTFTVTDVKVQIT